jgi:Domain of unknown function (DUF4350)
LKFKKSYLFFITACFAVLVGCQPNNKIPDLTETYSKTDKKPFGTYVAHKQLQEMYYTNTIREKKQSFYTTWNEIADKDALYVLVAKNLFVTEDEVNAMLDYVKRGNDLFIAAANIDTNLLSELSIVQHSNLSPYIDYNRMEKTSTNFEVTPYRYYYLPFTNYFSGYDTNQYIKPIAKNENGRTNCLVYFYGKGKLFLHTEPRAFSNYFLLQKDNYQYLQNILAYTNTNPEHLYWDDYYRSLKDRKNSINADGNFSTLDEIMKHPALKAAFWLSLLLLLLYILFGGKRRQRIIEPIKPNENTTVTFTETIGRLYLQKKDNKNIAEKMCTYFNEYVRNNYFLNTNLINDEFLTTLGRKSGIEKGKVETLYRAMAQAQNKNEVSDFELLQLNEQIQNFYRK